MSSAFHQNRLSSIPGPRKFPSPRQPEQGESKKALVEDKCHCFFFLSSSFFSLLASAQRLLPQPKALAGTLTRSSRGPKKKARYALRPAPRMNDRRKNSSKASATNTPKLKSTTRSEEHTS